MEEEEEENPFSLNSKGFLIYITPEYLLNASLNAV